MSDNEDTRYIAVHEFLFKDELNSPRDPPQRLTAGSVIPPGFFTSNGKHDQAYADRLLKEGAIKHYDQGKREQDAIAHAQAALDAESGEQTNVNGEGEGEGSEDDGFGDEGAAGGEGAADGSNVNEAKDGVAGNAENAGNAGTSVETTAKTSTAKVTKTAAGKSGKPGK